MSYQILTTTDAAYEQTMRYLQERYPAALRVASRRRHMLGVDDLTTEAMRELEAMGAEIVDDIEYAMEAGVRR